MGRHDPTTEPAHGDRSRYVHLRCRCVPCTASNAAYMVEYRARKTCNTTPDPTGSETPNAAP